MSEEQPFHCESQDDCNDRGFCYDDDSCVCDVGWFGDTCTTNLKIEWPGGFYAYRIFFLIFYSFLFLYIIWKLNKKLRKESRNYGKKKRYIFFLNMWSPLNILLRVILCICVSKKFIFAFPLMNDDKAQILWLAIDPFDYENVFTPSLERFLFEILYACMSVLFAIVLWVWYTIYLELTIRNPRQKKYQTKFLKPYILFGVIFIVLAQTFVSVTKGYRNDDFRIPNGILTVLMFIINVSFIILLTMYGILLYKCIKAQEKAFMILAPNPDKNKSAVAPNLNQLRMNQASSSSSKSDLSNAVAIKKNRARSNLDVQSPYRDPDLSDEDEIPPIEPTLQKLQSCPVQYKNLRFRKISHPVILEEPLHAEMDQKIHELEEENRQGVIFKDEDEVLENEKQIKKIEKVREDLEFKEPILREPRLTRAATVVYRSGSDLLKEKKIQDIVQRDQSYFRPIEKKKSTLDLDTEASIIINENEEVVWDVPDDEEEQEQERQIQTSKAEEEEIRQNFKKSVEKLKKKDSYQHFISHESRSLSELYIKRLLKDPEYIRHHQEVIKTDEKVIKRIIGQTVTAIVLGIISALLNLIVYLTSILGSSLGVLFFIWINGLMTISSILAILTLFLLVRSPEKENLRLISRIGKSKTRISGFYAFVLPDYLRQDESKKSLEMYINYVTTSNPGFLPK